MEPTFRHSFNTHRTFIEAVPLEAVRHINTDVGAAATTVLGLMGRIFAFRERFLTLPDFDITYVDRLEDLAKATLHIQAMLTTIGSGPAAIDEMIAEGVELREILTHDAKSLVLRKQLDGAILAGLDGGNGRRKLGLDLIGIANGVRPALERLGGKTTLTAEDLDRAEVLGARIVKAVGDREFAESQAAELQHLRAKAFTLLVKSYDQIRRAVAYFRHDEGDVDVLFPSLFAGKKARTRDEGAPANTGTKPQLGDSQSPDLAQPVQDLPPISKDGPFR